MKCKWALLEGIRIGASERASESCQNLLAARLAKPERRPSPFLPARSLANFNDAKFNCQLSCCPLFARISLILSNSCSLERPLVAAHHQSNSSKCEPNGDSSREREREKQNKEKSEASDGRSASKPLIS